MPLHLIAAIALLAGGTSYLVWATLAGGVGARSVRRNLGRDLPAEIAGAAGRTRHGLRPDQVRRLAGTRLVGWIETLCLRAGLPERWPVDRVLAAKLVGTLAASFLGLLLCVRTGTTQGVALAVFLVAFVFFLPDLLLWNTGIKRRQAVALELPDTLDQMSIAVEAGLGFDAAMARVAHHGRGVMASELLRTLQDIQVGQPRRTAYEALAERAAAPELRRFIRSVVQAEEYGIPLAEVLHTQAGEMRVARRQRAERSAMEIPVKVTFPLILFLMPALFVVILGPAVLSMIEAFTL